MPGEPPPGPLGRVYSDAARRCSDIVRSHIVCGEAGKWCAIRLSDGGSDGRAYETRGDAVRFQLHEQQCAYVRIPLDDMSPAAAESFLKVHRQLYDAGFRPVDPERPDRELMMPAAREQLRGLAGAVMAQQRGRR